MKELTYNVTCSLRDGAVAAHLDMKVKIKRLDSDTTMEQARLYLKKLIILVNKAKAPMLFYAVDWGKFPTTDFWHVIYKLKQDDRCPYITLRMASKREGFM